MNNDIEAANQTTKKAAKAAAQKFEANRAEATDAFRDMTEKGVERAKDAYARMKSAAEETTDLVEDTYLHATKGATEFNLKALEAVRANVNANFDYARELLAARTLSEAVELSSSHVRRQFDALATQTKELSALAQKVATDTSEPLKSSVNRLLKVD